MADQSGMMGQQPPMPWDVQQVQYGQSTPLTQSAAGLAGILAARGFPPDQIARTMYEMTAARNSQLPKFDRDPVTGFITRSAPGEPPAIVGQQQGWPGSITQEKGDPYASNLYYRNGQFGLNVITPKVVSPQASPLRQPTIQQPQQQPVTGQRPQIEASPQITNPSANQESSPWWAPATAEQAAGQQKPKGNSPALENEPPTGMMGAQPPTAPSKLDPSMMVASADKYFTPSPPANPNDPKAVNLTGLQASPAVVAQLAKEKSKYDPPVEVTNDILKRALTQDSTIGRLPNEPNIEKDAASGNATRIMKFNERYSTWLSGNQAATTDAMKKYADLYQNIITNGNSADEIRPQIRLAEGLLQNDKFTGGPFANLITGLRSGVGQIGQLMQNPTLAAWSQAAAPNQVFTKIGAESVLRGLRQTLGDGAGRYMQREIDLMERSRASVLNTPEASKALLEMMNRITDRTSLIARMARTYHNQRGTLDDGFDLAVQELNLKHPTFTDPEGDAFLAKLNSNPTATKQATPQQTAPQPATAPKRGLNPLIQLIPR